MTEPVDLASPRCSLWDFAVQTYSRVGVAPTCLRLQDEHGLDVDVMLACLWLADHGLPIDEPRLAAMLGAAAPAHPTIARIRELRRAVTSAHPEPEWAATRQHLQAAELAAERVELERIEAALVARWSRAEGNPAALARAGLHRYAEAHGHGAWPDRIADLVERALGPRIDPS